MLTPSIKKYYNAFGLIEVLISVAMIAVIMAAMVGIAKMVLMNTVRAQERAQAVRLAQEGIEIVRQIRDTAWIDRDNQTEWDKLSYSSSGGWSVLTPGDSYKISFSNSNPDNRYYLESTSGAGAEILLDGGSFYRKIEVENITNLVPSNGSPTIGTYAKKVTVTVLEPSDKSVKISEIMTNWRPNY